MLFSGRKKNRLNNSLLITILIILLLGLYIGFRETAGQNSTSTVKPSTFHNDSAAEEISNNAAGAGNSKVYGTDKSGLLSNPDNSDADILKVHFLDVGQADSILIQSPENKAVLIDAGNNSDAEMIIDYIKKLGITKLDYVVGTHPHEDHIGGLDAVIKAFDLNTILLPKAPSETKTFEDVLTAVQSKNLKITSPRPGDVYYLGSDSFTILSPASQDYAELNNYSIVIRLSHGNTNFLFMGDTETLCEKEILNSGMDIASDVIKVGHHGSTSSSSEAFLEKVKPRYAIISVGEGNKFGHPEDALLERLENVGIKILRTDKLGTIIFTSDGTLLSYDTAKSPGE